MCFRPLIYSIWACVLPLLLYLYNLTCLDMCLRPFLYSNLSGHVFFSFSLNDLWFQLWASVFTSVTRTRFSTMEMCFVHTIKYTVSIWACVFVHTFKSGIPTFLFWVCVYIRLVGAKAVPLNGKCFRWFVSNGGGPVNTPCRSGIWLCSFVVSCFCLSVLVCF